MYVVRINTTSRSHVLHDSQVSGTTPPQRSPNMSAVRSNPTLTVSASGSGRQSLAEHCSFPGCAVCTVHSLSPSSAGGGGRPIYLHDAGVENSRPWAVGQRRRRCGGWVWPPHPARLLVGIASGVAEHATGRDVRQSSQVFPAWQCIHYIHYRARSAQWRLSRVGDTPT